MKSPAKFPADSVAARHARTRTGRPLSAVLLVSAAAGFAIGLFFPAWHVAIEPAQWMAGLVAYPHETPFSLYEGRLWTGWHQVLAPILAAGVSERALTLALSGVIAALSFASLTAFAYGLGADADLAIATPFVLGVLNPTSWNFWYPIILLGHGHTYGIAGLAWLVLVCGVLAAERWGLAAFLIGVSPAVHASLGAWLGLLALISGIHRWRDVRPQLPAILRGGVLGASITALSLASHLLSLRPGPTIDPAEASRYLDGFVRLWDAHRQPGDVNGFGGLIVCVGVMVAVALVRCARREIGAGTSVALGVYIACGVLGITLALVQQVVPPEQIPNSLLVAMPARLLNLPALAFVPLLVGVLGRYRSDVLARALLFVLVFITAIRPIEALPALWGLPAVGLATLAVIDRHAERRGAIRIAAIGMAIFGLLRATKPVPLAFHDSAAFSTYATLAAMLFAAWLRGARAAGGDGFAARIARSLATARGVVSLRALGRRLAQQPSLLNVPLRIAIAATVLITLNTAVRGYEVRSSRLRDRTTDRVLAAASRGQGFLMVAPGIQTPQLITRRPILIDPGALDMLPYALAAGPEMERILRVGYGIEFFAPPIESIHNALLPGEVVKATWERRSPADWAAVATRLGVTDVLVPARWTLRAPEVERNGVYALYHLPEVAGTGPSGSQ